MVGVCVVEVVCDEDCVEFEKEVEAVVVFQEELALVEVGYG